MEDSYTKDIPRTSLEDSDQAVYNWVNEVLNISVDTNKGFSKVPVKWVAGEKSYQAKNSPDLRDDSGALILPLITIERVSVTKDPARRGAWYYASLVDEKDNKGSGIVKVSRKIKQDKTGNFSNAYAKQKTGKLNFRTRKKEKVVYEEETIPYPTYVEATYKISLRSEYQQQMNDMTHAFITQPGSLNYTTIRHNHLLYEAFLGSEFSTSNTVSEMESERKFETDIELKVVAPIFGSGINQQTPTRAKRETVVEVKIARERTILNDGDFPDKMS